MKKCSYCYDEIEQCNTGEMGQLGSLNCAFCDTVKQRLALNKFIGKQPTIVADLCWYVRQRTIGQERATAASNLIRIAELYAVGDSSARIELAREIARVTS